MNWFLLILSEPRPSGDGREDRSLTVAARIGLEDNLPKLYEFLLRIGERSNRGTLQAERGGDSGIGHFALMHVQTVPQRRVLGDGACEALARQFQHIG
jgi:hypothetical protein